MASLNSALVKIKATQIKTRKAGLEELRRILDQSRNATGKQKLNDEGYSKILDDIFKSIDEERFAFSKKARATDDKLLTLVEALRTIVEHGVKIFRRKRSAPALVAHIVQSLSTSDGQVYEPLARLYGRILRTFLEYRPHTDHLTEEEWRELISLCILGLNSKGSPINSDDEQESDHSVMQSSSRKKQLSRSGTPATLSLSFRSNGKSRTKVLDIASNQMIEDFCACLAFLSSATHQPLLSVASPVLDAVFSFLETASQSSYLQTQEHAFAIVNHMLSLTSLEAIDTAASIVTRGLPYLRDLWHFKAHTNLKDQMLIFLLRSRPLFPKLMALHDSFSAELQQLSDTLFMEYGKRRDADGLQMEDLILRILDNDALLPPMATTGFQLHTGFSRSEQAWVLLSSLADIAVLRADHPTANVLENSRQSHAPKRRKTEHPILDIVKDVQSSHRSDKLATLQLIAFIAAELPLDPKYCEALLETVIPCIVGEDPNISGWAILVATSVSCNSVKKPSTIAQSNIWKQLWTLGTRALAISAQCRAAAHLLNSLLRHGRVTFHEALDSIDSILTAIDLSGPAVLYDTTCHLWCTILQLKVQYTPGSAFDAAQRISQWLFKHWQPSIVVNRTSARKPQLFQTTDIVLILEATLGIFHTKMEPLQTMEKGTLASTQMSLETETPLQEYLLLKNPSRKSHNQDESRALESTAASFSDARLKLLLRDVFSYLDTQVDSLLHSGVLVNPVASDKTSSEVVRVASTLSIVTITLTSNGSLPSSPKTQQCRQRALTLTESISRYIQQSRNGEAGLDGLFAALGDSISVDGSAIANIGAYEVARCYNPDFWKTTATSSEDVSIDDIMAIDESFDSQLSKSKTDTQDSNRSRQLEGVPADSRSYRACQRMRTMLAYYKTLPSAGSNSQTISDDFFKHVSDIKDEELVDCRSVFKELLSARLLFSENATSILLQHVGGTLLEKDEFERLEAAHCMTLEVLNGTVDKWAKPESEACDTAEQLYEWFVKVAVPRRILSPTAQIELAGLLQNIMEARTDYGTNLALEMPRKVFLRIFEEGSSAVKYAIGKQLPQLFKLCVLKEHELVLDDVFSSLPIEPDCLEATAVRLRIMVWLGAAWPTLLRRCLYAIVEAPALVAGSTVYAECCFKILADRLNLSTSKDLYKLFAPQIIYTWLDGRDVFTLPFKLFGYATRHEFLSQSVAEIAAQMIMRGQEKDLEKLTKECGTTLQDILQASFSRAAAYCLGRDASIRPELDPKASNGIMRLKKLLGRDQFVNSVLNAFPGIMSTLFKIADREESFNRGLGRHQSFSTATDVYGEIMSSGASQAPIDVSQQPSFKSSNLMDEIEFLRNIVDVPVESLWTPAMYVYIFRDVIGMIQPALGSLNTCTVIRRLRILISIAGDTTLQGYPLEMTLHALRGFITDSQCAEDVIGICRYLLSHATSYLQSVPSFLVGFAVSTMVSLRAFMNTPRDSTTQESDHITTMSRAQEFHSWLYNLLIGYNSARLSSNYLADLKTIAKAASQIHGAGSSRIGTAEGELLLGMILGGTQERQILINDDARESILEVLCTKFDCSPNYREDILGDDRLAASSAALLLQTLTTRSRSIGFRLWISRTLGRAYAGSGAVVLQRLRKVLASPVQGETASSLSHPANGSRRFVLQFLVKLLSNNRLRYVEAAEKALHSIMSVKREPEDPVLDCIEELPDSLKPAFTWSTWSPSVAHLTSRKTLKSMDLTQQLQVDEKTDYPSWLQQLCVCLIECCPADSFISKLVDVVEDVPEAAPKLFSPVLHMALLLGSGKRDVRGNVSAAFRHWMDNPEIVPKSCLKQALDAILYLRGQPLLEETTKANREEWLEIDYRRAAIVAVDCGMHTTALLFLETTLLKDNHSSSRRATSNKIELPVDLLLKIYQNVDDKDSFYGIRQPSTLASMLHQLEFENAGFKSLSFRGADYDSHVKEASLSSQFSEAHVVKLLDEVQLNGISLAMISSATHQSPEIQETMFTTARKLEKWDITAPSNVKTQSAIVFKAFQDIHDKSDMEQIVRRMSSAYSSTLDSLLCIENRGFQLRSGLETLAILSEIEDVITSRDLTQVQEAYERIASRISWMETSPYDDMKNLDSCRQTIFGVLNSSKEIKSTLKLRDKDARVMHIRALLDSSKLNRAHKALQTSLNIATQLTQASESALELGVKVDIAVALEASHVLWDQGEMSPSIRMLQDLLSNTNLQQQDIPIGKPQVLAVLGHRISKARLEQADEVIDNYLKPAIKELKNTTTGPEAGQVFHEFAEFCDMQLQDPGSIEDLRRLEELRESKKKELDELKTLMKTYSSQAKEVESIKPMRVKAQKWYELDDRDYRRLKDGRAVLLSQSLENYLLCLRACDSYDNDALRFTALWLENYENDIANSAVKAHIHHVPSRKFASLMNQWTSRQQDVDSEFQKQLFNLVLRICNDHPFHGMYHVFTSSKSKGAKDPGALSRNAAANKVANKLKEHKRSGQTWISIHNSNVNFVRFASDKPQGGKAKEGAKIALASTTFGPKLEQDIRATNIPPPTMSIPLRADCNYDSVPRLHKYMPDFTLASGISMPKIVTAITSDGSRFKQLFKSGNDDLRQDAIMEQVFEQVSALLKHHSETRQRDLRIRTYKVLPLTASTGIIEFVTNTMPLNNYLIPAHAAHYPQDMKPSECRRAVSDAQEKTIEERVRVFRKICDKFHPVMRYFFTDRFLDPDEWFEKRLMFSRSTAAISMLGHILGLGDRHGQNILLDEKTGEVVHIDLGIAFETGRVLMVPEVVPFRLTRDLVDGMGITGTEGVFRRCCEFTMEALRKEEYSIMTILDVLRYDPLYNWSVSPLRLKRLQDAQKGEDIDNTAAGKIRDKTGLGNPSSDRKDDEAERALTVVRKKLSKSLSVAATVNELIQQATDPRNLAVLFAGWAAYL